MFKFGKRNQDELTESESKKINEKFNSFKNKKYSEDDMHKVFDNEETILNKMNDKNLYPEFLETLRLVCRYSGNLYGHSILDY